MKDHLVEGRFDTEHIESRTNPTAKLDHHHHHHCCYWVVACQPELIPSMGSLVSWRPDRDNPTFSAWGKALAHCGSSLTCSKLGLTTYRTSVQSHGRMHPADWLVVVVRLLQLPLDHGPAATDVPKKGTIGRVDKQYRHGGQDGTQAIRPTHGGIRTTAVLFASSTNINRA